MPKSKKRKEAVEKKKEQEEAYSGGLLTRMRGGFKGVAGAGPKKPESIWSKILTWALVAAAAYFVAKRFGIIR